VRTSLVVFILAIASASLLHAAEKEAAAPTPTYEAKEHYRFNLGGDSGMYTDWERMDLDGFDGLTTTVSIEKTYGKPGDKWASIARIMLFGAGDDQNRPQLSFTFVADRKNGQIEASIMRSKDTREAFDAKLAVGKPFTVSIVPQGAGKLLVAIDKATYEVPSDLDVKAVRVIGSGVDVKFEPFNLLKHASP
jgi:hypothetical protein